VAIGRKTSTHQEVHINQHLAEPVYKEVAIGIVPKDFPALDSTHDDVLKRTRNINSGFSWHIKYSTLAIFQFYLILEPQDVELFRLELYDIRSIR
jgi:hypothetical protein